MSIEIVLTPENASRAELVAHLFELGYQTCRHLWDWPAGSQNFHWFQEAEHLSFDGVEATVYRDLDESIWLLHTRTRSSASNGDRQHQNRTIRSARKKFGGSFYNDWSGRNRYIKLELDSRDAVARGIYLSYEMVSEKISSLRIVLPEADERLEKMVGTPFEPLADVDPTRVLYNALFPFAVAAIEHFFSQSFKIMLRHDSDAQVKLRSQNKKIEIPDVYAIRDGEKTIEDVVAEWYSFQNIGSIHTAFKEWFGIDFQALIRRRKKIGIKLPILERRLAALIDFRHGVVHRFALDHGLRKQDIVDTLNHRARICSGKSPMRAIVCVCRGFVFSGSVERWS
ncbi:hypothetical protein [Schlesneria sp. DSM 10557]|uniref:hypothetical protein n=1 Tax=Schlesneria sp. DSM 10557 TaxID=3044399 RepID=UPI0035A1A90F